MIFDIRHRDLTYDPLLHPPGHAYFPLAADYIFSLELLTEYSTFRQGSLIHLVALILSIFILYQHTYLSMT